MTDLINNILQRRYEIAIDGSVAFVTYTRDDKKIVLIHTEVPVALGGKGVGTMLARLVLEEARRLELKVVPECDFIAGLIKRNSEFADLVADPMSHFTVKFFKTVFNDTGHEFEECQGSVDAIAVDKAGATAFAKLRFCETEHVRDWSLHADRIEVLRTDLPS